MSAVSRLHAPTPLGFGSNTTNLHHACHPVQTAGVATSEQLRMHAEAAIGLADFPVYETHLFQQGLIRHLTLRLLTVIPSLSPFVVAAGRDLQHTTQTTHRVLPSKRCYVLEPDFGGCVQMAIAFFRISLSSCRLSISRFKRRISSDPGLNSPSPFNAFSPCSLARRVHCRNRPFVMPSSRSISTKLLSLCSAYSMASRLKSALYFVVSLACRLSPLSVY